MSKENKLRKQCEMCLGRFVVPVLTEDCPKEGCWGSLIPCAEDLEDAIGNILSICSEIKVDWKHANVLKQCVDDLESFAEGPQSPRDMGWVDDRGLP